MHIFDSTNQLCRSLRFRRIICGMCHHSMVSDLSTVGIVFTCLKMKLFFDTTIFWRPHQKHCGTLQTFVQKVFVTVNQSNKRADIGRHCDV